MFIKLLILSLFCVEIYAQQPEVYTSVINSLPGEHFIINATAQSFVYDEGYNFTNQYQSAQEIFPDPQDPGLYGFDFAWGGAYGLWSTLGFAKYKFEITSSLDPSVIFFTFYIDFRTCLDINFYDIKRISIQGT